MASVVQFAENQRAAATGSTVVVTLGAVPTIGNFLVACAIDSSDNDIVESFNNGTWTKIAKVYSGNGTNWPNMMYYQPVTGTLSAATTFTSSKTQGQKDFAIIELSGVNTFDRFISTNNTATTSGSITPVSGKDVVMIAGVGNRHTTAPSGTTPSSGMTNYAGATLRSLAANYRIVNPSSGSYTIGATGANGNSSFIGAAFYQVLTGPRNQGFILGMRERLREAVVGRRTIFVPDPIGYARRSSGLLVPA